MPGDSDEQDCSQGFNGRITRRYVHAAIAAASAQNQIADDRNVVVRLDCRLALWTSGVGKNDRLLKWNSMDDDVEETTNDGADRAEERAYDWQRHFKGAIYRRHDHPKSLYRGCDQLPTDF